MTIRIKTAKVLIEHEVATQEMAKVRQDAFAMSQRIMAEAGSEPGDNSRDYSLSVFATALSIATSCILAAGMPFDMYVKGLKAEYEAVQATQLLKNMEGEADQ